MRKSVAVYVIASSVLAAVGLYEWRANHRERSQFDAMGKEYERRLASLETMVEKGRLVHPVQVVSPPVAGAPFVPDNPLPLPSEEAGASGAASPDAPQPRVPPSTEQIQASLDATFYGQDIDTQWVREAEGKARDQLAPGLPANSRLLSVECRSSLCRVESSHESMTSFTQFARASMHAQSWEGPEMVSILENNDNGSVVSVAYLGRPGAGPLVPEDL